jgi:hypothetical protein
VSGVEKRKALHNAPSVAASRRHLPRFAGEESGARSRWGCGVPLETELRTIAAGFLSRAAGEGDHREAMVEGAAVG